jgi:hypothetical protein
MATNPYPGVVIGGGGAGTSPITITGGGGAGVTYSAGTAWTNTATTTAKGQLKLEGNDADIFVQGKSMKAWMETVEQRLAILEPKPELLKKYKALEQAYEHYKTLEAILYDSADQE